MSTGEDDLVFESLLRKRKDRMKLKWVTYWFRLENTTLFFYSKKHGSAHLKGQYYLYMVQSVRQIHKAESKRYVFEITLKNGKRKLLAADTADLRQTWVDLLWKAMQLPESRNSDTAFNSLHDAVESRYEVAAVRQSRHGSSSGSDNGKGAWETEQFHPTSDQWDQPPPSQDYRLSITPQATPPDPHSLTGTWRGSFGQEEEEEGGDELQEEGHYDVLPPRSSRCLISQEEEDIYDVPLCNMRATEDWQPGYRELTESIYDVPKSLLEKMAEQSLGAHVEGDWPPSSGELLDSDRVDLRGETGGVDDICR
ncbi:hypothetical protein MATL_G00211610 [Megalops atlanticus]|uniref:PH domain-containing protein n=1 Tax=Megalops atlanticus TaxID=7932 RepID=A0A9D3PG31_MEGAT|nr:hypothetical protein MATL_G00211610 [Megalops atlanticus]